MFHLAGSGAGAAGRALKTGRKTAAYRRSEILEIRSLTPKGEQSRTGIGNDRKHWPKLRWTSISTPYHHHYDPRRNGRHRHHTLIAIAITTIVILSSSSAPSPASHHHFRCPCHHLQKNYRHRHIVIFLDFFFTAATNFCSARSYQLWIQRVRAPRHGRTYASISSQQCWPPHEPQKNTFLLLMGTLYDQAGAD